MSGEWQRIGAAIAALNRAEVRLATLRHDERPAVPENPHETVGEVVRAAEAELEMAKRTLRRGG